MLDCEHRLLCWSLWAESAQKMDMGIDRLTLARWLD